MCCGGAAFALFVAALLFNQEARKSEEYHVNAATTITTLEYPPPGSGKNRGDGLAVGPAESLNL